jgi:DNA-binding Lrp family transcriptional regulator
LELGVRGELDSTDLAILKELQADGNMTNVELARRVGLSAPPCLRRVKALEDNGVILGYRALVSAEALGFQVAFFAQVQLSTQGQAELEAFESDVQSMPAVRQCWKLSGEVDYILKCITKDMTEFQDFVVELTGTRNVRNVRTALALKHAKDQPLVPLTP